MKSDNMLLFMLGLLLLIAAPFAGQWVVDNGQVKRPVVGIIKLNMDIWAGSNALFVEQINEARQDDQVKAVVVQMNSPGGEVVASQNMYLELQNLRREMPVVASIDTVAASGGYYISMAADPLFVKPFSNVGNVGAWSFAPLEIGVVDEILATGPFKLTASNSDEFQRNLETIKREFLETVFSQRGERLNISRGDLSQGLLYDGREAIELGLADEIGTLNDAVTFAAEQAGLSPDTYEVVDLQNRAFNTLFNEDAPFLLEPVTNVQQDEAFPLKPWVAAADPFTGERDLPPGIYLLHIPGLGGAQ